MTQPFPSYPEESNSMQSDEFTRRPLINEPWYGIGFIEASKRFFTKGLRFRGFASRSEYWYAFLFTLLLGIGVGVIGGIADVATGNADADGGSAVISTILMWVLTVVLIVPSLSLTVRRLHDSGNSGWLVLLIFIPLVGWIAMIVFGVLATRVDKHDPKWADNQV